MKKAHPADETAIRIIFWFMNFALWICIILTAIAHADESEFIDYNAVLATTHLEPSQKITCLAVLSIADYFQTVERVVNNPDRYEEKNPLLGKYPRKEQLALFGITGISTAFLISKIENPIAQIAVDSIIASEELNVWINEHSHRGNNTVPIMIVARFTF